MIVTLAMARYFLLSISVLVLGSTPAYAYLDPATGSMILQAIATIGIGAMLYLAWFWKKIKGLFGGSADSKAVRSDEVESDKGPT